MRILLLHASAGAGHQRAAEALAHAFQAQDEHADVVVCDILDFTPKVFRESYAKGYLSLVRRAPELWGYMYAQTDRKAAQPWRSRVRATFNKVSVAGFFRFYDRFDPDIAVCTHFLPLELLSSTTRERRIRAPFYGVVTDFAVHGLWIVENVGCYYLSTEEGRRHLVRRGQDDDRIRVLGIPIDPAFAGEREPREARRRLGLAPEIPVVLLLGGGHGVGSMMDLLRSFQETNVACQVIAVAGANEPLRKEADAVASEARRPVTVLGRVDNVHELMDASDIIVGKSGGLTSSEAMAKGRPMIITDPIPGQEQRNCEFLLEAGAALRLYEAPDAPFLVKSLLEDPDRLARMQRNARRIGRPHAARDIVEDIRSR